MYIQTLLQKQYVFHYDGFGGIVNKVIDRESVAQGVSDYSMDVSSLSSGVYYYSVRIDGALKAGKFIVE